jgi:hypothetical protein
MPDYWEEQFGLNPDDPVDTMRIAAGGYSNLEHYLNSTNPRVDDQPVVYASAIQPRASASMPGRWRIARTGSTARALRVSYRLEGTALAGRDYSGVAGDVTIPAGATHADVELRMLAPTAERIAVLRLLAKQRDYAAGCPGAALIVLGR